MGAPGARQHNTENAQRGWIGWLRGPAGRLLLALVPLLLWAAWMSVSGLWADGSLKRVQQAGVLRVGYAVEAPYALVQPDGRISGESPETARRLAERLGVPRVEWVQVPFGELMPALLERRFDLIAAGLFITPERARQVRFSDPTVQVYPGLLVRRGNPRRLVSSAALSGQPGVRVAVLAGSVEQARLQALGVPAAALVVVPDAQAGRAAVANGLADALALSLPTLRWLAQEGGVFEVLHDRGGGEAQADQVGFAFHPRDTALLKAWNRAQAGWIGGPDHLRVVQAFGFAVDDLVTRQAPDDGPAR